MTTTSINMLRAISRSTCAEALAHARNLAAEAMRQEPDEVMHQEAFIWLHDIIEQCGCEHLDTGTDDSDRLTSAISVIVRG